MSFYLLVLLACHDRDLTPSELIHDLQAENGSIKRMLEALDVVPSTHSYKMLKETAELLGWRWDRSVMRFIKLEEKVSIVNE